MSNKRTLRHRVALKNKKTKEALKANPELLVDKSDLIAVSHAEGTEGYLLLILMLPWLLGEQT